MQHVTSQLISKRAELKGEIEHLNKKVKELKEVLKNIKSGDSILNY